MGRVYEQMPHPKIAYAYLAIEAETWNEFEKLRSETLKRHPLYSESAFEKKSAEAGAPTAPSPASAEAGAAVAAATPGDSDAAASAPGAASAPTSAAEQERPTVTSEGLSPRDKAKAALAAKKTG